MGNIPSKIRLCFFLAILLAGFTLVVIRAEGSASFQLTPSENCHIAQLNSDQPYVAGYQVIKDDFSVYGGVDGTAVTASFPSTDPESFASGDWLGAGMFLQAQDTRFKHVDYGFYVMLVVDFSGKLFIDVGLHQTREASLPIQAPSERTVYAHSWQFSGINITTPVTLVALWDSGKTVHYSVSSAGSNVTVMSVNVSGLPDCGSIIPKFYQGNVIVEPFPFSRYVNYFQFGVTSSRIMENSHWQVRLNEPQVLQETGWICVEKAWSTQGDISYLDADWRWGGLPYEGVNAQYYQNPLRNPLELVFYYDGNTLSRGTVLWDVSRIATGDYTFSCQRGAHQVCPSFLCALGGSAILVCVVSSKRKRPRTHQEDDSSRIARASLTLNTNSALGGRMLFILLIFFFKSF